MDDGAHAGVNRFLLEVYRGRGDLQEAFPDLAGDDAHRLVAWAHEHGRTEVPIPDHLLPPLPAVGPAVRGANVCGYLSGALGLGESARQLIGALDSVGYPVLPVDISSEHVRERPAAPYGAVAPAAATLPVTVAYANPDLLSRLTALPGAARLLPAGATVGFMWWEVEDAVPELWRSIDLSGLAEIWVGSEHVRRCLEPVLARPIVNVGSPVEPPPVVRRPRAALGLPEDFLFLTTVDYNSDLRRKNPLGAIQAFAAAFAPGSGTALVIKTTNAAIEPRAHALVVDAARSHPDIHVVDGVLSDMDFWALIDSCDCFVSLCRAEGFGIPQAMAARFGKPVVATAYSGPLDFLTAETAYLVGARMTRVGGASRYPADARWAEPDLAAAVEALRAVREDPAAARARGALAAAAIRTSHSAQAVGTRVAARLDALAAARLDARSADLARALSASPEAVGASRLRRAVRRQVARALRPWTEQQHAINLALVDALRGAEDAAAAAGQAQAATLAVVRRQERDALAARATAADFATAPSLELSDARPLPL